MNLQAQLANLKQQNKQLRDRIELAKKSTEDTTLQREASTLAALPELKIALRSTLKGHGGKVFSIAWRDDSRTILSTSQDETMISWDGVEKKRLNCILFPNYFALSCCYHPTEPIVLAGSVYSNISIYKEMPSSDPIPLGELKGHTHHVTSLNFIGRNQFISSGDRTIILWDVEHKQRICTFKYHRDYVMEAFPAPDNSTFISGACDRTAIIWDMRSGKPGYVFPAHEGDVNSVHFFPTGLSFATGCEDGSCSFWDIRSNKCLMKYAPGNGMLAPVNSINFSKTGRILFAGYDDGVFAAYDILKGAKIFEAKACSEGVKKVRVSPNGLAIATCGDNEIKIWS